MSEYQYYEFVALDAPLTREQQAELRKCSSRGEITSTSFVNEYHWGDLKAHPLDWMARYFDAHVYSSNWGSSTFMLKLPKAAIDQDTLAPFSGAPMQQKNDRGGIFSVIDLPQHWILRWELECDSEDDERFGSADDGPGWMGDLRGLRDELLRGDLRALYLGWLAAVCACQLDDEEREPPVPPGLRSLTLAQQRLVDFLLIDTELLDIAARASADIGAEDPSDAAADAWLEQLPEADMRAALRVLLLGDGRDAQQRLRAAYRAWLLAHPPAASQAAAATPATRTVGEIEAARAAAFGIQS